MPHLPPGYRLLAFDTIDSTNEEARRRKDVADRTVIWAARQTAGRGRRGRAWMSEPGNLFVSIVVRPNCPIAEAARLSFVAGLAVSDLLQTCGLDGHVSLKWPNDVLVDGDKVCGILLEAASTGGAVDAVIIGIGLNVASHPEDTPYPATDLLSAGAGPIDPESALEGLTEAFEARYAQWQLAGFTGIRQEWLARAHGRDGDVVVNLDGESLTGRFADLDEAGALILRLADGTERHITAGDVFFPR